MWPSIFKYQFKCIVRTSNHDVTFHVARMSRKTVENHHVNFVFIFFFTVPKALWIIVSVFQFVTDTLKNIKKKIQESSTTGPLGNIGKVGPKLQQFSNHCFKVWYSKVV